MGTLRHAVTSFLAFALFGELFSPVLGAQLTNVFYQTALPKQARASSFRQAHVAASQAYKKNDGESQVYESIRDQVLYGNAAAPTLFRQLPVRLLGYTNEVGESFKPYIGMWTYIFTYAVTITYVCSDTVYQTWLVNESLEDSKSQFIVVKAAIDVFIWQMLASVMVSGFVVKHIVLLSQLFLNLDYLEKPLSEQKEKLWYKSFPTIMGMLSIPCIVKPIDTAVTMAMDYTIRWLMDSAIYTAL